MRNQPIRLFGDIEIAIPQYGTESTILDFRKLPIRGITVYGPETFVGTDVAFEVTWDMSAYDKFIKGDPSLLSTIPWRNLQSGGANIKISSDEAVPVDFVNWMGLRFVSDTIETSKVVFVITAVEDLT